MDVKIRKIILEVENVFDRYRRRDDIERSLVDDVGMECVEVSPDEQI